MLKHRPKIDLLLQNSLSRSKRYKMHFFVLKLKYKKIKKMLKLGEFLVSFIKRMIWMNLPLLLLEQQMRLIHTILTVFCA
jgi:hypothetical protein